MLVRVVNDNVHPYKEKFRGNIIAIEPKGYVEMDFNDAHLFLGTIPSNLETDANGIQKPECYKMLRIEKPGDFKEAIEVKKYVCHACKIDMINADGYIKHVEEYHMDAMLDDKALEKMKKKPGRPAKGVSNDSSRDRDSSST